MDFVGIAIQFALLIIGFVLLIKGSDFFVDGSSNIASILKVPTLIVGLTIVAFGTSAPEAAVSITSSLAGSNALALSNVIGSNLFNMLLIIGLCALLNELKITKQVLNLDLPFLVFLTGVLTAFILFGWQITQIEGIILIILISSFRRCSREPCALRYTLPRAWSDSNTVNPHGYSAPPKRRSAWGTRALRKRRPRS